MKRTAGPDVRAPACLLLLLAALQAEAQAKRRSVEQYLLQHIAHVPDAVGPAGGCFRLLRAGHLAPTPVLLDLLRCCVDQQLLRELNPFLSPAAAATLQAACLLWGQLCVLEDRLQRLVQLLAANSGDEYLPVIIRVRASVRGCMHMCCCHLDACAAASKTACSVIGAHSHNWHSVASPWLAAMRTAGAAGHAGVECGAAPGLAGV